MAETEHVSPEETVTHLLKEEAKQHAKGTPAEEMIGALSSGEDSAIIDAAMEHVRALRQTDHLRDLVLREVP